jgi:hypothetical protein
MLERTVWAMAAVLAIGGAAFGVRADDAQMEAAGRQVLATYDKAVIVVTDTIKVSIQGDATGTARIDNQEKKNEAMATVIDASGLALCSLAALDPTTVIGTVRATINGQVQSLRIKGELSEIKYRLADGTEIPARVVLKDDDADLALLAPEKALEDADKGKISAINLADAVKDVQVMDPVIMVVRLSRNLGYAGSVGVGRISAKLGKPRVEYLVGGQPGLPAFNRDGKLLGVVLTHRKLNNDISASSDTVQTPVLIPAADIVDAAAQAKEEAKKPVKKPDAPAEEKPAGK